MSKWPAHPAADLFPMLAPEELQALADDIKEKGQLEAIVLYDGQVLDGRNRLAACDLAGVEPRTVTMGFRAGEIGPTEWVISKNLHRRQLSKSQAAAVAVEALPMLEAEAKERQGTRTDIQQIVAESKPGQARDAAAEMMGVNRQYVSDAKKLREDAPETYERVKAGTLNIQQAKREAKVEQAQRDPWTERDKELKAALEAGRTVVLNASSDARVIGWAQPKGLVVYVDRTSPWGNPFVLNADGDRNEVCDAYAEHYLPHKPSLQAKLASLKGKGLVCHCAPLRCHADALKELVA
jgi:ParB-like chromosome segregation protein Spo0J